MPGVWLPRTDLPALVAGEAPPKPGCRGDANGLGVAEPSRAMFGIFAKNCC